MIEWSHNRGCGEDPSFESSCEAFGLDVEAWDDLSIGIQSALCGASDEKLEAEYPMRADRLRLYITVAARGLPSLRVAFRVAEDGKIWFVSISGR
jgi:hypothetical protein